MKFVIDYVSKCSGRVGKFTSSKGGKDVNLKTPLLLLYTKCGSIPNLGREVVNYLVNETQIVEISVSSTEHMEEAVKLFDRDIASFTGLDHFLTFITPKDTMELTKSGFHEKGTLAVFNKSGRVNLTPQRYMNIIEAFQPTFYQALCDGDTNSESSKKRLLKAVERSEEFLDECVERQRKSKVLQDAVMIGAVEGGYNKVLRSQSIKSLQEYPEIGGYVVDGLHNNGTEATLIDHEGVKEIVEHCIKELSEEKPRFMLGAYNPLMVLELAALGVDVFDSTYPCMQAKHNLALSFNFKLGSPTVEPFQKDLSEKSYKENFIPILDACMCHTCRNHTQAYIHHLITTNELLAPILITIHNLHQYMEFFKTIRDAIAKDQILELTNLISTQVKTEKIVVKINKDKS